MKNLAALTRRELLSVYVSPLAAGTAAMFLFLIGLMFTVRFMLTRLVDVATLIDPFGYILPVLLAPVLTMRLLSEERRLGTLEMLLTAPVSDLEVVLSKFLGVMAFYASLMGLTAVHVGVMRFCYDGGIDWGTFVTGYLGMLLIAGLFLSFGLFVSAFFETPILAALTSFIGGLAVLTTHFASAPPPVVRPGLSQQIFTFLMPFQHFKGFLNGSLDTRDLSYFVFTTAFFLFLTTRVLESRKWK
ncbi:MAG: ABC transporter permease subunit [Planctomycetota bacterium]|nr:ABC transporter permease subunit [Planctomycetota bacterium]